jgi:DNA-directed RNA polymerase I, II, and III subunit RPABC5
MTCGKPLAGLWDSFKERVAKGEKPGDVLTKLGLERYCCRTAFLTQKDQLSEVAAFRA